MPRRQDNSSKALVEDSFTAGVLHNIGRLALAQQLPGALGAVRMMAAAFATRRRYELAQRAGLSERFLAMLESASVAIQMGDVWPPR